MKDGFRGARRCCSAISVYDALAGEKVLTAQNTIAACAKTFANRMQPLIYLKVEQSRMARGYKTGGRTSGTPNRKTQAVIDRLRRTWMGSDRRHGQNRMDETIEIGIRAPMYKELAQYVASKKAVEVRS